MKLYLERHTYNTEPDRNIIGSLYLNEGDDEPFCHTLEDELRGDGVKVHGKTAIPAGEYKVKVTMSPRFKRMMPLLENVPMFEGIRIHGGNDSTNTEGCILVAFNTDGKRIWGTAERELTKIIAGASECSIKIVNKPFTHV